MHRFMPACLRVIELIDSHMPPIDSLDDADTTVRLHLYKLELLVLNDLLLYLGKFTERGSSANIEAMERLIEHKKVIQDVVDMIEKCEKPVTIN
jgi:hypothetical protein